MRKMVRGLLVCALALALLGGQLPAQPPSGVRFGGTWTGSARLSNEWGASSCTYQGGATPPSITLEIAQDDRGADMTLTLEIQNAAGAGCPALRKHYESLDARVSSSALTFSDPSGQLWNLALKGDVLQGVVAWKGGSVGANGFFEARPLITTGAGDHFNAGFLSGLLAGIAPDQSLQIGGATSGVYVRTGVSPTRAQVCEFLLRQP